MLTADSSRKTGRWSISIDWAMTPEKAVEMYLEWRSRRLQRSLPEYSHFLYLKLFEIFAYLSSPSML